MSTLYHAGAAAVPSAAAPGQRYTSAAALCAAIRAAAELAPEFDPRAEFPERFGVDPARRYPFTVPAMIEPGACIVMAPARGRGIVAEVVTDGPACKWPKLAEAPEAPGPFLPCPDNVRVSFHYAAGAARGCLTVANVRGALLALADRVHAQRGAFDGQVKRAPRPKAPSASAPHVTARAMLAAGDVAGALQVAETRGAVFFGHSNGARPILYMAAELCEAAGMRFAVARMVESGRFRVLHAPSTLSVDSVRAGAPDDRGFSSGAAALDWLETSAASEDWRAKLGAAAKRAAAYDQAAARAAFLASAAPEFAAAAAELAGQAAPAAPAAPAEAAPAEPSAPMAAEAPAAECYSFPVLLIGTDGRRMAEAAHRCAGAGLTSRDIEAAHLAARELAAGRGLRVVSQSFADGAARAWCEPMAAPAAADAPEAAAAPIAPPAANDPGRPDPGPAAPGGALRAPKPETAAERATLATLAGRMVPAEALQRAAADVARLASDWPPCADRAAAVAAGRAGRPEAAAALALYMVRAAAAHGRPVQRDEARRALATLQAAAAEAGADAAGAELAAMIRAAAGAVERMAADAPPDARRAAAVASGRAGDPAAAPALCAELQRAADRGAVGADDARQCAAGLLAALGRSAAALQRAADAIGDRAAATLAAGGPPATHSQAAELAADRPEAAAPAHPPATHSQRAPRDGDRFRIHERSAKTTGGAVWTGAETYTAQRAADVARCVVAGYTSGARWATCAETGALLYGIDAAGRECSRAEYFPPIAPEAPATAAAEVAERAAAAVYRAHCETARIGRDAGMLAPMGDTRPHWIDAPGSYLRARRSEEFDRPDVRELRRKLAATVRAERRAYRLRALAVRITAPSAERAERSNETRAELAAELREESRQLLASVGLAAPATHSDAWPPATHSEAAPAADDPPPSELCGLILHNVMVPLCNSQPDGIADPAAMEREADRIEAAGAAMVEGEFCSPGALQCARQTRANYREVARRLRELAAIERARRGAPDPADPAEVARLAALRADRPETLRQAAADMERAAAHCATLPAGYGIPGGAEMATARAATYAAAAELAEAAAGPFVVMIDAEQSAGEAPTIEAARELAARLAAAEPFPCTFTIHDAAGEWLEDAATAAGLPQLRPEALKAAAAPATHSQASAPADDRPAGPSPATHSQLTGQAADYFERARNRCAADPRPKLGLLIEAAALRETAAGMRRNVADGAADASMRAAWSANAPAADAAAAELERIAAELPEPPAPARDHLPFDGYTGAWVELRRSLAGADEYRGHVLAAMREALAAGLSYNADTYPRAAAIMAQRWGYPDAREIKPAGEGGVGGGFASHCYMARQALRAEEEREENRAAAAKLHPGQKFGRLIVNGKTYTGAAIVGGIPHTGEGIELAAKCGGRSYSIKMTAAALVYAIERTAERAELRAEQRQRRTGKPAPARPASLPIGTEAAPAPATHSEPAQDAGPWRIAASRMEEYAPELRPVHVLFTPNRRRALGEPGQDAGQCVGFYMARATYRAIPAGELATPADFERFGPLQPAPADFLWSSEERAAEAQRNGHPPRTHSQPIEAEASAPAAAAFVPHCGDLARMANARSAGGYLAAPYLAGGMLASDGEGWLSLTDAGRAALLAAGYVHLPRAGFGWVLPYSLPRLIVETIDGRLSALTPAGLAQFGPIPAELATLEEIEREARRLVAAGVLGMFDYSAQGMPPGFYQPIKPAEPAEPPAAPGPVHVSQFLTWPATLARAHHAAAGRPGPLLRIPDGDPRAAIPPQFAPAYPLR